MTDHHPLGDEPTAEAPEREGELAEQARRIISDHSEWHVDGEGWSCVGCNYWVAGETVREYHPAEVLIESGWRPPPSGDVVEEVAASQEFVSIPIPPDDETVEILARSIHDTDDLRVMQWDHPEAVEYRELRRSHIRAALAALRAIGEVTPPQDDLMERGRQLASQRDDLIVAGVDPNQLKIVAVPYVPGEGCDCPPPWSGEFRINPDCPEHGGGVTPDADSSL